ncbi:MAG: ribosome maturation factor RimM [Rhodothermales bacterium]
MSDVQADTLLLMGRIWRPHGLDGEVKIIPETDDPKRFEDLEVVHTGRTASTTETRAVEKVRFQTTKKGTLVIVKLEGVDSREKAAELNKSSVFVRREDVPPLADDEYFVHDLIGLTAVLDEGGEIGLVDNVLDLPGQNVLVIAREGREPAMVPAVPEFVRSIDLTSGRVVIRPIEGLLEE